METISQRTQFKALEMNFYLILFFGFQQKYKFCSCRKSEEHHHHYSDKSYNFEDYGWNGVSNMLSRILQTVDDVTFQVVDVKKKKHKKRRKKVKNENDTDKRGDST